MAYIVKYREIGKKHSLDVPKGPIILESVTVISYSNGDTTTYVVYKKAEV